MNRSPCSTIRLSSCPRCMYHGLMTFPTGPGDIPLALWITLSIPSMRGMSDFDTSSKSTPAVLRNVRNGKILYMFDATSRPFLKRYHLRYIESMSTLCLSAFLKDLKLSKWSFSDTMDCVSLSMRTPYFLKYLPS